MLNDSRIGLYEVTFKRKLSDPVSVELLREQVRDQGLEQFSKVIGLGGKEYRLAIAEAFQRLSVEITFPFAGLPIGKAMQATKIATLQSLPQINDPRTG